MNVGRTLYWLATIVTALILVWVLAELYTSAPIVRIIAVIAAVAIWLIGLACRALLS